MAASEGQRDASTRVGDTRGGGGSSRRRGGASVGEDLSAVVFGGPSRLLRHNQELRADWKHAEREAFIWHWRVDRALARLALLHRPDMVARETGGKGAEGGVGVSRRVRGGFLFADVTVRGESGERAIHLLRTFHHPLLLIFIFSFSIRCSNTHTHMHARTYTHKPASVSAAHT